MFASQDASISLTDMAIYGNAADLDPGTVHIRCDVKRVARIPVATDLLPMRIHCSIRDTAYLLILCNARTSRPTASVIYQTALFG